jgi:hypothetical protein
LIAILLDAAVIEAAAAPLVTCEAVIAESCYLLRKQAGAADAILENVKTGVFQIPLQLSQATASLQRLFRKYRDRETHLDNNFEFYRWGANRPFHLLLKHAAG